MQYKRKDEINENEIVTGVVYTAKAEEHIRWAFDDDPPVVIGYIVKENGHTETIENDFASRVKCADDTDDTYSSEIDLYAFWIEVDLDRKTVLTSKRRLTTLELTELAAINRRLGFDVTK